MVITSADLSVDLSTDVWVSFDQFDSGTHSGLLDYADLYHGLCAIPNRRLSPRNPHHPMITVHDAQLDLGHVSTGNIFGYSVTGPLVGHTGIALEQVIRHKNVNILIYGNDRVADSTDPSTAAKSFIHQVVIRTPADEPDGAIHTWNPSIGATGSGLNAFTVKLASVKALIPTERKKKAPFGRDRDIIRIIGDLSEPLDVDWDAEGDFGRDLDT